MRIEGEFLRLHTDENRNAAILVNTKDNEQVSITMSLDDLQRLREQIDNLFSQSGGGMG